jgi:hypothetical protein
LAPTPLEQGNSTDINDLVAEERELELSIRRSC